MANCKARQRGRHREARQRGQHGGGAHNTDTHTDDDVHDEQPKAEKPGLSDHMGGKVQLDVCLDVAIDGHCTARISSAGANMMPSRSSSSRQLWVRSAGSRRSSGGRGSAPGKSRALRLLRTQTRPRSTRTRPSSTKARSAKVQRRVACTCCVTSRPGSVADIVKLGSVANIGGPAA